MVKKADDPKLQEIIFQAQSKGLHIEQAPPDKLEELAEGVPHQGVVALCTPLEPKPFEQFFKEFKTQAQFKSGWPLILAVDQVTDPRNFGALVRSALAANVDAIILPKHHRAEFNAAAYRASAGLLPFANLVEATNLTDAIEKLKPLGLWWAGASLDAPEKTPLVTHYQLDFCQPIGLVVGSEGKGIRNRVLNHCDFAVSIPMAEIAESLNVSVATGILLFECQRQRLAQVKP